LRSIEEIIVRNHHSFALIAPLLAIISVPAYADTELTGKWVGPFHGVQIEVPADAGPFGYEAGEARTQPGPRYIDSTLTISFDSQQKGLAVGSWSARQFKQRVVCAQLGATAWNCVDATGRSSIEVTSASELKVCYLDSRQGALGAGCAVLKKSG
jgi:hypothetical protein